jgi:putative aldouronate transport system substrate-binding protein
VVAIVRTWLNTVYISAYRARLTFFEVTTMVSNFSFKTIWLLILVMVLVLSGVLTTGVFGAGQNEAANSGAPAQTELIVKLFGARPKAMDAVIDEIAKRTKDSINVKLNMIFNPMADYKAKIDVSLASGEANDIVFTNNWSGMMQQIAAGYYEPLDSLLAQYGPNIISTRWGPDYMKCNTFPGPDGVFRQYVIPLTNAMMMGDGYYVRRDLRRKHNVPPIKTWGDLINFGYVIKKNEPKIWGFSCTPVLDGSWVNRYLYMMGSSKIRNYSPIVEMNGSYVLYLKNNDGMVYNLFDEMEPAVWNALLQTRKLYTDGVMYPDLFTQREQDLLLKQGGVGASEKGDFGIIFAISDSVKQVDPKAEYEYVSLMNFKPGSYVTRSQPWNFVAVPAVSKNKEKAIQFLNWANSSQDNYDLCAYGIKGVTWEPVGNRQYKFIGGDYAWFPYAWIWEPTHDRLLYSMTKEDIDHQAFISDPANFTKSILTKFAFNLAPIQDDLARIASIDSKYYVALFNGYVDPAETWPLYKAEASKYYKRIQREPRKTSCFCAFPSCQGR